MKTKYNAAGLKLDLHEYEHRKTVILAMSVEASIAHKSLKLDR